MILSPGSFRVSAHRRPVPVAVKLDVMIRQRCRAPDGRFFDTAADIQFDHDPALELRPFDTEAGDFIPPQHHPAAIVARRRAQHLQKTSGRKEGAEKTVTTRGSDNGEATHAGRVRDSELLHQAKMALKDGDRMLAADLVSQMSKRAKRHMQQRQRMMGGASFPTRNER